MNSPSTSSQAANDIVVFVHVPKAAGATLRKIMDKQYDEKMVYRCDSLLYPAAFNELLDQLNDESAEIRCLIGHLPYGIHEYLPGPVKYMTMMRDPVARFLSKYTFLHNKKWVADQLQIEDKRIETLESFIDLQIERNAMNFQTRQISGSIDLHHQVAPFEKPMTVDDLEKAKKILENEYSVVGLQEHFNASLLLMKQAFGWGDVRYLIQNVSSRPVKRDKISPQTRELIEQHNDLDRQLFDFAKERFAKQVQAYGPGFERDLAAFERDNERFLKRHRFIQKVKGLKGRGEDFVNRCLAKLS